jgi:hypothetical protein
MSESDRIRLKRGQLLCEIDKLPPILSSQQYTGFIGFQMEQLVNTKEIVNQLQYPTLPQRIFDIETDLSGVYPIFVTCNNTNTRSNRTHVPLMTVPPLRSPAQPIVPSICDGCRFVD